MELHDDKSVLLCYNIIMNCIVLQPKASELACINFDKTIINGIKKELLQKFVEDHDWEIIKSLGLGSKFRVWGVMDNNTSKFRKLGRGDLVLFTAKNVIEAYGKVAYSFYCPSLARFLWGQDEGETWNNIYIVEDFHYANDIPVKALNRALGYQENNVIQGFTVIDDKSRINGFYRDFDYSNGILTLHDSGKTAASLTSILDLLNKYNGLSFEEIQSKTDISREELESLLNGGVRGKLFRFESGKYYA